MKRKLKLNKKTIVELSNKELAEAVGGISGTANCNTSCGCSATTVGCTTGATCSDTSQEVCATGIVTHCC